MLSAGLELTAASGIWETAPWGSNSLLPYYNQALTLKATESPEKLMQMFLQMELEMGRERSAQNADRVIDIDMLLFENRECCSDLLMLPHPRMQNRRFVLAPLAEIAGDWVHPGLALNVNELLHRCTDELAARRLEVLV